RSGRMNAGQAGGEMFHATGMHDLDALADFLRRACMHARADDETMAMVRLATEEVFVNIHHHGYRDRSGPVSVHADAGPGRIAVTLVDAAPDFDPADAALADLAAPAAERDLGGLGWHLVHRVMDSVVRTP